MTGQRQTSIRAVLRRVSSWTSSPSDEVLRLERWAVGAVVLAALVLVALRIEAQPFDPDELGHLHSAWLWHQGLAPYVDFFEHHPPFYWLLLRPIVASHAPAGLHGAVAAARWLSLLVVVGCVLATGLAGRQLLGSHRAGWYSAAAWAVFCALSDRSIHARPDMLMMLLLIAGSYCVVRGTTLLAYDGATPGASASREPTGADPRRPRPSSRLAATGGVLLGCGVCVLSKGVFWVVPFTLAMAIALVVSPQRRSIPHQRAVAAFVLGGAAIALLMVMWILSFNEWGAFWHSNLARNQPMVGRLLKHGAWWRVLTTGPLSWPMPHVVVAGLGLLLLLVHRAPAARWITLVLGCLGGAALIVLGLARWHHYHFPLLWWMTALVGFAFAAVTVKMTGRTRAVCGALVLLPAALVLHDRSGEFRGQGLRSSVVPYQEALDRARPGDTMVALAHRNPVFLMSAEPSLWLSRMIGQSKERDLAFLEAIERQEPRFVVVAPFRPLRVPSGRVLRYYDPLNQRVLERRPDGTPRRWRPPRPGGRGSPPRRQPDRHSP